MPIYSRFEGIHFCSTSFASVWPSTTTPRHCDCSACYSRRRIAAIALLDSAIKRYQGTDSRVKRPHESKLYKVNWGSLTPSSQTIAVVCLGVTWRRIERLKFPPSSPIHRPAWSPSLFEVHDGGNGCREPHHRWRRRGNHNTPKRQCPICNLKRQRASFAVENRGQQRSRERTPHPSLCKALDASLARVQEDSLWKLEAKASTLSTRDRWRSEWTVGTSTLSLFSWRLCTVNQRKYLALRVLKWSPKLLFWQTTMIALICWASLRVAGSAISSQTFPQRLLESWFCGCGSHGPFDSMTCLEKWP